MPIAGALLALLLADDPFGPRPVSFSFEPVGTARTVSVVGGFNNWDRAAFPLKLQSDGKTWSGTFSITPGIYPYKFVEDASRWVPDPNAPAWPDGNGNINSKLVVAPSDFDEAPGIPGDGKITTSPLRHRPDRRDTLRLDAHTASVSFRTRAHDVAAIYLVIADSKPKSMRVSSSDELYDTWKATFEIGKGKVTSYVFELEDGEERLRFGSDGTTVFGSGGRFWSRPIVQSISAYPFPQPPSWVQDAVFYQIFPDRFANGDPSNDGLGTDPWGTKPTYRSRMGGDLSGIEKHLSYLKNLGVSALYLNPIFEANANHAYDTVSYERVDPRFGSNLEFKTLVQKLKAIGVRTILDGVFNHSSPDFFAFKDLRANGADSKNKGWYYPLRFPIEVREGQQTYRTFAGVPSMPKLNQDNPECRSYFLGIGDKWIREFGIDGWRLDVADEVSHDFWRAFRKTVRKRNPNAYILGEEWGDAHEYLQGDEHDAAMNYRWRQAVLNFLAYGRTGPAEFDRELRQIREDYPALALTSMFNLLGSHDTERLRTILKGDNAKERLAVLFQFTYPGVPSIYYGDEIGMEGGRDPDNRRCMEWDRTKWESDLFSFYRAVIKLHKERVSLRRGDFRTIAADDSRGLFRFERRLGKERTQVIINVGSKSQKVEITGMKLLMGESVELEKDGASLGPMSFLIADVAVPAKRVSLVPRSFPKVGEFR